MTQVGNGEEIPTSSERECNISGRLCHDKFYQDIEATQIIEGDGEGGSRVKLVSGHDASKATAHHGLVATVHASHCKPDPSFLTLPSFARTVLATSVAKEKVGL